MEISSVDASFWFGKILKTLTRIYSVYVMQVVHSISNPEPSVNDIQIFKNNVKSFIANVRANTSEQYAKFRSGLDKPIYVRNAIECLNYLYITMFSKLHRDKDKRDEFEFVDEEEIFLSVMLTVMGDLWNNRYLFHLFERSKFEIIYQKSRIIDLIRMGTEIGIDSAISNIFISNSKKERVMDMREIIIDDKTRIRIPEHKLQRLIRAANNGTEFDSQPTYEFTGSKNNDLTKKTEAIKDEMKSLYDKPVRSTNNMTRFREPPPTTVDQPSNPFERRSFT